MGGGFELGGLSNAKPCQIFRRFIQKPNRADRPKNQQILGKTAGQARLCRLVFNINGGVEGGKGC